MKISKFTIVLCFFMISLKSNAEISNVAELNSIIEQSNKIVFSKKLTDGESIISSVSYHRTPKNIVIYRIPKSKGEPFYNLYQTLKNREYWLVYYSPKEIILGGEIGIFIDAKTREVIYIYIGR